MKNGADTLEDDAQLPGEIRALSKHENFSCMRFGADSWVKANNPTPSQIVQAKEALDYVRNALSNPNYDIIIADEILYAIQLNLLKEEEIIKLIKNKPSKKELILTGSHKAFLNIFEHADLVTEIKKHKHPFDNGYIARKGIEY